MKLWTTELKAIDPLTGELTSEIPCKEGTDEPDWGKKVDFDVINNN